MTALSTVRKQSNFLKRLYNAQGKSELRKILLKASSRQIKLLVGLVFNALKGNIHLTPKLKKLDADIKRLSEVSLRPVVNKVRRRRKFT